MDLISPLMLAAPAAVIGLLVLYSIILTFNVREIRVIIPTTAMKLEKGQDLVEYELIPVLVAVVAIIIMAACIWILALAVFIFWAPISAWGSALVAGVIAVGPMSILITAVIVIVLAFVIFGRRRS